MKLIERLFGEKPYNKAYKGAYSIVYLKSGEIGFHCYDCDRTSYHPEDVKNKYCNCCHEFKTDLTLIH